MNREIEYIMSVTTSAVLDATGAWIHSGGLPQNPDEVVIRQITFSGIGSNYEAYLLDSSLGVLGSVACTLGFVVCPQTRIQLRNPLSQSITFQLRQVDLTNAPLWDGDHITVVLDFIKYRK